MNKQAPQKEQKKGGIGAAFGALTGVIDDIVKEVKQDLREMTPAGQPTSSREKMLQEANSRFGMINSAASGLAESTVAGAPPEMPLPQAAKPAPSLAMPAGNLWHALHAGNASLRADAVYHALTPADVESYARAVGNETVPPFTLGIVAANIAALTEEELEAKAEPELLTQTLLQALQAERRLYGAVGAGPRQLWPNLESLDRYLTEMLNSHRKLVALGPIGLDEPFAPYTLPQQQAQLALQLEIAADFGLPVLLTTRKTQARLQETLGMQKKLPPLVYMDALTTAEDVALVKAFDMYALARPELTQPDFAGKDFYRELPVNRLLLASGSALVAPHGFAGHFNQPKFLDNSLAAMAKLRGSTPQALGAHLAGNLVRLLNATQG